MKYSLIISFSLLCLLRAGGLQAQTELQDPTRTSSRSEMPGIQIGSYNSRELALTENDKESLYMQRLNGKWQVKTYRSETEIDTTLGMGKRHDSRKRGQRSMGGRLPYRVHDAFQMDRP